MPGVPPRLSWADRHQNVRVPGMLAVVIGNGGNDENEARWGWYVYETDEYRQLRGEEFLCRIRQGSAAVDIWNANEEGIWPLTH